MTPFHSEHERSGPDPSRASAGPQRSFAEGRASDSGRGAPIVFARIAGTAAIAVAAIVLLGWVTGSEELKGALGVPIAMKANTAAGIVLTGISLLLAVSRRRSRLRVSRVLGLVVAALGGLTLAQHLFGWNLGIDEILFSEPWGEAATSSPGRMGPPAATSFLLIGLTLALLDCRAGRSRYPFRHLVLGATLITLISMAGYLFGSPTLYAKVRLTAIAWPTALSLLLLSLGIVAARPDNPLVKILGAPDLGGVAARRLLIPSVLLPVVLLAGFSASLRAHAFDPTVAGALLAVGLLLVLPLGVLAVSARISAAAEREEGAHARLSAIVESSNDAIIGQDLEGVVTSWNRGATRLFGYTAAEMIGQPITVLVPPEFSDEETRIAACIRSGLKVEPFEAVRRRRDGSLVQVSIAVSPILDREGRVAGASKIARDIGAWKALEAERETLLRTERAARSDAEREARLRDEFLAVVSHELRTPLNSILGWVTLLKRRALEDPHLAEGLAVIERGARIQTQLIGDLLDMNRIMSGKLHLDARPTPLGVVIEAAAASVRQSAEAKGIALRLALADPDAVVHGDANRLQQVAWNLLTNAIKFTPRDGTVEVSVRRAGEVAALRVRDTGIGIRADFLPHVFERFRQADSTTTRAHGGLGLGLSIVKHLVELHGGTVRAESDGEGRGASFTAELPLATAAIGAIGSLPRGFPPPPRASEDELRGLRVLAVDDDPDALELVRRVLSLRGAQVAAASGLLQALEALQACRPDVLVSDIAMPGCDGYELIRRLREEDGAARPFPAIAVTAFARPGDRERALRAGFEDHLAKPMDADELVAAILKVSGRGGAAVPRAAGELDAV